MAAVQNYICIALYQYSKRSANGVDLLPIPSVGQSVSQSLHLESLLWQNGLLDPGAIWDGEWGRSRDKCVTWGGNRRRGRCSRWVHSLSWGLRCTLPKWLWGGQTANCCYQLFLNHQQKCFNGNS